MTHSRVGLLIGLLVYSVAIRLLPYVLQNCDVKLDPTVIWYPWSFSPLTAVCLLSGACVVDRRWALVLPLGAMLVSNIGIALLSGHFEWGFPVKSLDGEALTAQLLLAGHFQWAFTSEAWWLPYLAFAGAVWLGTGLRRRGQNHRLAVAVGLGLAFEVAYFLFSNLCVWLFQTTLYPHTMTGLGECFIAALPFVRWSPISTAFFTLLVFGPLGAVVPSEKPALTHDLIPAPAR